MTNLRDASPDEGPPPEDSEMLGHSSSISIILDSYSHVIPGLGEVAARAMDDALGDDEDDGTARNDTK